MKIVWIPVSVAARHAPKEMTIRNLSSLESRLVSLLLLLFVTITAFAADMDGDGVDDSQDNCSEVANPNQRDTNGDGFGNRCDADLDNNGVVNFIDLGILRTVFFTPDEDADFNGDGIANVIDLGILRQGFFGPPGPGPVVPPVTYTNDVQPIFGTKCTPCHTGLGFGGNNIGTEYGDAFLAANSAACSGLNVAQCSIALILSGDMPLGAGCTGDPAQDAGNFSCLTQSELDTVQAWIDGGLLP